MDTNHAFYLGDCLDVLPRLPAGSVDLLLTDPPYNVSRERVFTRKGARPVNLDKGEWDRDYDPIPFLEAVDRVLGPNASVYIFTGHGLIGKFTDWFNERWGFCRLLVWHKTNPVPQFQKRSWVSSAEFIVYSRRGDFIFNFGYQSEMHDVLTGPICMGEEREDHPTQKPLWLVRKLMLASSREGDLVLDPYGGTGTVSVAAKGLARNSIYIEKEGAYLEIALRRMNFEQASCFEQASGQVFVGGEEVKRFG